MKGTNNGQNGPSRKKHSVILGWRTDVLTSPVKRRPLVGFPAQCAPDWLLSARLFLQFHTVAARDDHSTRDPPLADAIVLLQRCLHHEARARGRTNGR